MHFFLNPRWMHTPLPLHTLFEYKYDPPLSAAPSTSAAATPTTVLNPKSVQCPSTCSLLLFACCPACPLVRKQTEPEIYSLLNTSSLCVYDVTHRSTREANVTWRLFPPSFPYSRMPAPPAAPAAGRQISNAVFIVKHWESTPHPQHTHPWKPQSRTTLSLLQIIGLHINWRATLFGR